MYKVVHFSTIYLSPTGNGSHREHIWSMHEPCHHGDIQLFNAGPEHGVAWFRQR